METIQEGLMFPQDGQQVNAKRPNREIAGALVDGRSMSMALKKDLYPEQALIDHDTFNLIHQIGDDIVTGPTGTNVNDPKILLVGKG